MNATTLKPPLAPVPRPRDPSVAIPALAWLAPPLMGLVSMPIWLHWFEPGLFLAINRLCASVTAPVWTALSLLGNGWGVLGLTAPLLVLAPRLMWAWLCAAPFAVFFARTGKFLIESPRPAALVDNAQMRIVGETLHNVAMPSGHTLTAFAVASALFFALPAGRRARHAWLFVLAAGTGLSRIAVGAHWPGDVAAGASLGLLAGMLGHMLWTRMGPQHSQPDSWSLRLVAVLLAVAVYHLLFESLDFSENLPFQYLLAAMVAASLAVFVRQNRHAFLHRS
jgi:membrane-associated phospholipid phosphatase